MTKNARAKSVPPAAQSMGAYTILSAQYANADQSAAVIVTQEAAAVLVSEADTPDHWASLLAWGTPAAYEAPPPPEDTNPVDKLTAFLNANPDVKALIE